MTDNDDEIMTVPDAEITLIGQALDALGKLARLRLALAENRPAVDVDDVAQPALRIVVDDAADLLAVGVMQADGSVRQLQGYRLSVVRRHLVRLAEGRLRDEDAGPSQWH